MGDVGIGVHPCLFSDFVLFYFWGLDPIGLESGAFGSRTTWKITEVLQETPLKNGGWKIRLPVGLGFANFSGAFPAKLQRGK